MAQSGSCDPQLNASSADPYGYRLRTDRCEGIYIKEVAGTALRVVSFTQAVDDFDPTASRNLLLEWTAPADSAIRLRASSLRHRLYYRMDALRPAGSASYSWPTSILAVLGLRRNELGMVAWTPQLVGDTMREVYLPLRVRHGSTDLPSQNYTLLIVSNVELAEVFVSLAPVGRDGRLGPFVKRDQPLNHGFYPAERGITITIPKPAKPGIQCVEIGATLRGGGSSAVTAWFYHPGD